MTRVALRRPRLSSWAQPMMQRAALKPPPPRQTHHAASVARILPIQRAPKTEKIYDVLVIGAGLAGITTAQKTVQAGLSTLVLESQARIGGRAYGNEGIFKGYNIQLGGYWFHGVGRKKNGENTNPLYSLAKHRGFHAETTHIAASYGLLYIDGKRATPEQVAAYRAATDRYEEDLSTFAAKPGDGNAGDLLPWESKFAQVIADEAGMDVGGDIRGASGDDAGMFRTGRDYACKEGMDKFVGALAEDLPVRTNTAVKKITWGPDGVTVETTKGVRFKSRRCVITVPLGILKAGRIEFDPPLPKSKTDAIDGLEMGLLNKTFLLFDSDVFASFKKNSWVVVAETGKDGRYLEQGAIYVKAEGKPIATVFTGGAFGDALEKDGKAASIEFAKKKVAELIGEEAVEKHFVKGFATAWRKTEWALGSYSYAKAGCEGAHEKLRENLDPLFFAGEACESAHTGWGGSFAAAYHTGQIAGNEVISHAREDARREARDLPQRSGPRK